MWSLFGLRWVFWMRHEWREMAHSIAKNFSNATKIMLPHSTNFCGGSTQSTHAQYIGNYAHRKVNIWQTESKSWPNFKIKSNNCDGVFIFAKRNCIWALFGTHYSHVTYDVNRQPANTTHIQTNQQPTILPVAIPIFYQTVEWSVKLYRYSHSFASRYRWQEQWRRRQPNHRHRECIILLSRERERCVGG